MARIFPKFKSFSLYNSIMQEYLASRVPGECAGPVAHLTSGAPVEILEALGFTTVYPENYGAICGSRQAGGLLSGLAERRGAGGDLCSYAKCHIGSMLDPGAAPLGGMPKPDLLVCCNNICGTVLKWYQYLAREYGAPLVLIDVPFLSSGKPSKADITYIRGQMKELIRVAEKISGRTLGESVLLDVLDRSREALQLWSRIRSYGKLRPSPLGVQDLFLAMAPIVVLRGREEAVNFYREMAAELEERKLTRTAALPEEKHRLIWDNIAVWPKLFRYFRFCAEEGALFVADTYTNAWSLKIGDGEPLEELARVYAAPFINLDLESRIDIILEMAREYSADGLVFHANRSCKPFSFPQPVMKRLIRERSDLPVIIIEADMSDERSWNEASIRERMGAFFELLG